MHNHQVLKDISSSLSTSKNFSHSVCGMLLLFPNASSIHIIQRNLCSFIWMQNILENLCAIFNSKSGLAESGDVCRGGCDQGMFYCCEWATCWTASVNGSVIHLESRPLGAMQKFWMSDSASPVKAELAISCNFLAVSSGAVPKTISRALIVWWELAAKDRDTNQASAICFVSMQVTQTSAMTGKKTESQQVQHG